MPKRRSHPSRPVKKKFQGNQFTSEQKADYVSTSSKKMKHVDYDDIDIDANSGYVIIDFLLVFNALSEFLVCKSCSGVVKFSRCAAAGVGFKLIIVCSCDRRQVCSSPMSHNIYEINRRIMFVFRILGCGVQSLKSFCGLMDIHSSFSNNIYYNFLTNLHTASKTVFEVIQKKAVREEVNANAEAGNVPTHVTVSGDGSWQKRGFSSLTGIFSLIGKYTVKILDVIVKSSFCQACSIWSTKQGTPEYDDWMETHNDNCNANHKGSAGKMEVDGAKELFSRSESLLGIKYKYYIGDGDTKTFKAITDMHPYDDCPVSKKECVGHVQKRMGSRLRKLKKDTKGLGGKGSGKLTDKLIADLTLYYGLAIRRNADSVTKMKDAIWATYYHKCSTNENPLHHLCPEDSWCKWKVAQKQGNLETFEHPPPLNEKVQTAIKPIYETLSSDDLLVRCLGANTQNCNESFNSTVWRMAPKHLYCGSNVIEICTYIAASIFNEGRSSLLKIMNAMDIRVGFEANRYCNTADENRILAAEKKMSVAVRNARIAQRLLEKANQENFEIEEGILYGPGIDD